MECGVPQVHGGTGAARRWRPLSSCHQLVATCEPVTGLMSHGARAPVHRLPWPLPCPNATMHSLLLSLSSRESPILVPTRVDRLFSP